MQGGNRSRDRRDRGWVPVVVRALVVVAVVAAAVAACTPQQARIHELVNGERAAAGAAVLWPSPHAAAKAQAWAEHLAASGQLTHSPLVDGMPAGFRILGENVGRGPSIDAVHAAFMASPSHRGNTLDGRFNWVGTGHAESASGVVYVVVVFAGY